MKGMIFKKAFLLGAIFLLATFMSVQLSWGCDDDDKWDCDCRDKWNCDHHGKPCHPPKIERIFLDYKPDSETFIRFSIWGKNFDDGAPPVVALGGIFNDLDVENYSDGYIIATLPMSEEKEFEYGDYRLIVSTCHDSACKDCEDHCSKCKDKYCRDYCSKCKDRYCKNKYCKDDEYKCKCRDRYSLTIPDPQGPPSAIGLKIESEKVTLIGKEIITKIEVDVKCGSGLGVTGGGYSCSNIEACTDGLRILASQPLQDDKNNGIGWHVMGTYLAPVGAELTVYAICTPVQ